MKVAGKGAHGRQNFAKEAVVAAAEAVVARGVQMRRAAALADHFDRTGLAFAAQAFLLTERQLHRGVNRVRQRHVVKAAQPMFGVDQMVAGVELSVGLHHQIAAAAGAVHAAATAARCRP